MKLNAKKLIAFILPVFILAGLMSCKAPAAPAATPRVETTRTPSPEPTVSPGNSTTPESLAPAVSGENPGMETSDHPGGDTEASPEPTAPTQEPGASGAERVTIQLESVTVLKGTILDPIVTVLPDDAEDKTFTLSSDDNDVLRQVFGFWTAVGGGSADLIATAANGVTGVVRVTVVVPLESIELSAKEITLNRGDSVTLTPSFTPLDTTETQVRFTSGDEGIASISGEGVVHAAGAGTTAIQCTAGGFSASCTVTVIVPVTGISISTDRRIYKVGDRGSLTVQISPQDATDQTFSAEVSSTAITLAGNNSFSCDTSGDATITVTAANGMTASQTVTVIDLVAYANEVLRLTNIERTKAGLEPLSSAPELTRTAVVRANETIQNFSHDRPDGRDCFTAFDENNVEYTRAGENIAMGQRTPAEVVNAWMDSPGHRENIMNADFGRLGVGVAMDSNGRLYWSQNFTD